VFTEGLGDKLYKLTDKQINEKCQFISSYIKATNAATGSEIDANSNIINKTIATIESELYKVDMTQVNMRLVCDKISEMYGTELANQYIKDLESHVIYAHDASSLRPYCASITLYPFLLEGTKCLGGVSKAPKNLQSFCGSFVNLIYQVTSDYAGAIATVEFLHYFDYFARKEYGERYLTEHRSEVIQELQGVVYALNQPASARGNQSCFWNISIFDKPYMAEMFKGFFYPDGTTVNLESTRDLQEVFMSWFRHEREKELLTFPVVTASMLTSDSGFVDTKFMEFCSSEMSLGNSFFVYMSDSVDSLSSCCRLQNKLADNTFSYTLGAGGVVTGSAQVITLNMNRIVQTNVDLDEIQSRVHKYLLAHKALYVEYIKNGLLPSFTAGFMDIDKQFLTIGINGFVEAAEYLGMTISNNDTYKTWAGKVLNQLSMNNKKALEETGCRFNCEQVPAEALGVKNANWDKADGLKVNRDCYNSYFYLSEDENTSILDKIKLHGNEITQYLDGGSALHLALGQTISYKQAKDLFELCRVNGVPYWTINVKFSVCNKCGYIDSNTEKYCIKCGSDDIDYATRVIGYLKRIKNFSEARQREAERRFYI